MPSENFRRIYTQGQKANGRAMTVHVAPLPDQERQRPGKLGMTLRRLSVQSSVDRNRWKRWIREVFRHHPEKLAGLEVVVTVFSAPTGWSYAEVEGELLRIIDTACKEMKKRAKIHPGSSSTSD
ncbi:MAG: ribonuclease P protein component [Candidatus Omnitrophica bacterium]|nr:ribonuclease P protein component [Candidatus Omnitrophota bacterium]